LVNLFRIGQYQSRIFAHFPSFRWSRPRGLGMRRILLDDMNDNSLRWMVQSLCFHQSPGWDICRILNQGLR
jgi:hypothetical protein